MFIKRLNLKKDGFYSVVDEVELKNGRFTGSLEHHNVQKGSVVVLDENGMVLPQVDISKNSNREWVTDIDINSNSKSKKAYIHYQSSGDIVDAEDINRVQDYLTNLSEQKDFSKKEIEMIHKQIEELKNIKAESEHTHSANDIHETFDRNFISMADKIKIAEIDKKADKDYVDSEVSKAGRVHSVNKQQGDVELTSEDIPLSSWTAQTVNNKLGALDLSIYDLEDNKADKSYVDDKISNIDTNQFEAINKGTSRYSFNNLKEPGVYRLWDSDTSPSGTIDDYITVVFRHNNEITQVAHSSTTDSGEENRVYTRYYTGSRWTSWRELTNVEIENELTNKADKSHTHSANDITETHSKKFVTTSEKLKINDIDNKADKSYVDNNISRTSTIVIANYDSKDSSKKGADIVIGRGENASKKINDAIQSLQGIGGEVKLMEGNYNLEYGIAVNIDGVHLTGIPKATILVQNTNWKGNPYANNRKHVIDTWRDSNWDNVDVEISNIHVKGAKVSDSDGFYCYGLSTVSNCISKNSGRNGFYCENSSIINNCISENSGSYGFRGLDSSTVTNCVSKNSGEYGFYGLGSSTVTNCVSKNSGSSGFRCQSSSTINNCISENSGSYGFWCTDSSTINNCISENSSRYGFYCWSSYRGVCSFNTLIGDKLNDNSTSPAVVQYNIIQEG